MQINVTFVIQIVNFGITYFFLNRFILKPMVILLQKRSFVQKSLLKGVEEKEKQLRQLIHQKNEKLVIFQQYLKKKYAVPSLVRQVVPVAIVYRRDDTEIERLIVEGKELLIKKVSHAH